MLLLLAEYFVQYDVRFSAFSSVTLRAILGALTALMIALLAGPYVIRKLSFHQVGQAIRDDGPQTHLVKAGTPTMGGALILLSIMVSTLLWADLRTHYVWAVFLVMLAFGGVGWVDDYRKVVEKNPDGLPAKWKFFWQSVFAFAIAVFLYHFAKVPAETQLLVPLFKDVAIELGLGYILLSYFVIVGSSNAVNLTDGLDGLAIMPTVMVAGALGLFCYFTGHAGFAEYLHLPFIPGVGELLIICTAISGAGLGFLWFNAYPAQVFMGDVGALSLGATLGVIAVIARQETLLFVMGGVFVAETISVILQVASFKLTGRRIFRMAPLHHHFELKGWAEPKVIVRFWIITVILVLVGIGSLKLR